MDRNKFLKYIALSALLSIFCLNVVEVSGCPKNVNQGQPKIGFAKCSLAPAIKSTVEFRRDLEGICMVIKEGNIRIAIIALDLIEISPQTNLGFQKRISELTGYPVECILIHTTHTHASPWDSRERNSIEGIGDIIAHAILKADHSAVAAKLKTGNSNVGKSLSFQRIGYTGNELGHQSFWYGFQYKEGDARPDASALVNEMKSRWLGNQAIYKSGESPIWFDREVDPLVQTMVFEDFKGKTIGSIVRFSAHSGPADACKNRKYDPDYPAVVRDCMEEDLGGMAMYLSGPLGNLAPKVKIDYIVNKNIKLPEKYLGPTWSIVAKDEKQALSERDRIGKQIASAALKSIKGKPAEEISVFQFKTKTHGLPLNPKLPESLEDIEQAKKIHISRYDSLIKNQENTGKIRLLANQLNWLEWSKQFIDLVKSNDREKGFKQLPLSVLKINNTCMAFTHSETMAETSIELRKSFSGLNLITVCLTGGSVQYIPTSEIIDMGGYEGNATITTRKGEEMLRNDIFSLITTTLK